MGYKFKYKAERYEMLILVSISILLEANQISNELVLQWGNRINVDNKVFIFFDDGYELTMFQRKMFRTIPFDRSYFNIGNLVKLTSECS